MLNIESLKKSQSASNAAIKKMESSLEALNREIAKIEGEQGRTREFIVKNVQAKRDAVLEQFTSQLSVLRESAQVTGEQKEFWQSKPLLLSKQKFDDAHEKDAQIKDGLLNQFSMTPLPLLNLHWQNAKFDKELPMVYVLWLAGQSRSSEAAFAESVDMALDGIEIPGQADALAIIQTCKGNLDHGEMIAAVASGARIAPAQRLAVAREQGASSRFVSPGNATGI